MQAPHPNVDTLRGVLLGEAEAGPPRGILSGAAALPRMRVMWAALWSPPRGFLLSGGARSSVLRWGHYVPQTLFGMRAFFGKDLPAEITFATQPFLAMALFRAYTGLANDEAGVLAGASYAQRQTALVDLPAAHLTARVRRELGTATSGTRSLVDMQTLHTQPLRTQAAPHIRAPFPATPYGEAARPAYGWALSPSGGRSSAADRVGEARASPYEGHSCVVLGGRRVLRETSIKVRVSPCYLLVASHKRRCHSG